MKINFAAISRRKFAIIVIATLILGCVFGGWLVYDLIDTRRVDAVAVTFAENRQVEFGGVVKASDFIENLNGQYITDPEIDTTKLGLQEVEFEFYNLKHRKRTRRLEIEVVDTTQPLIYGRNFYTVNLGYDGDLTNLMLSGDNLDDHPRREIRGAYDTKTPGDYDLEYLITDASGNSASQTFTLRVVEPAPSSGGSSNQSSPVETTSIEEAIAKYRKKDTQIGIDVSSWQGTIDWQKVKASGVEFAMLRLGYQADYGGEYTLDREFLHNIEGATAVGLPVGVYFYSCADSVDEARRQAEWVMEQIKDYPVELGIAYDWEEWNDFNRAGISFYTLQSSADAFLSAVEAASYRGLLYGSKNYLEKFWQGNHYAVWLAQYYDYPTYSRDFALWQFTDTGAVPGISGAVDLNVRYMQQD